MTRRSLHPVILAILALAVLGFFYQMLYKPQALMQHLIMIAVGGAVFFLLYKLIFQRRMGGGQESAAYRKAVKQSKKRMKGRESRLTPIKGAAKPAAGSAVKEKKRKPLRPLSSAQRKRDHLKVIEGKKSKKKNRALF